MRVEKIISKETKQLTFSNSQSVTGEPDNEMWEDQNDDENTKTVLGFIGTGFSDRSTELMMMMMIRKYLLFFLLKYFFAFCCTHVAVLKHF
jgi:hypothetical protein